MLNVPDTNMKIQNVSDVTDHRGSLFEVCRLTYADQVHEAVHAVADLEEDVSALPDGLRAERWPQQPGDAGHQEERAQEHGDDLHLLHQRDGDGLPLHRGERDHADMDRGQNMSESRWIISLTLWFVLNLSFLKNHISTSLNFLVTKLCLCVVL